MLVLAATGPPTVQRHIYASEIARGLDIFELTPTKTAQNEIDAAKAVRVAEFNVQNQEKI